jgi:hypothetical protein
MTERGERMAKLTAWVVTIAGVLMLLKQLNLVAAVTAYNDWLFTIGLLVVGISKLMRNYK